MQFQKVLLVGGVAVALLAMLWLALCASLQETLPNELPPGAAYSFDYVVVGAGTTGCVVASLLAKHSKASVLLVEAGDKFGLLSRIPLLATFQQQGLNDWGFQSVPQQHSSKGLNEQRQSLPRGKGLGGSAQLNFMLHFDGLASDFDTWASEHNLSEWRWEAVQPFLAAGYAKPYEMLEIPHSYSKLSAAFHAAEDEFAQKPWHFRRARYNVKSGLRWSVYQRFLQPVLRHRNLKTMTNTLAKQVRLRAANGGKRVNDLVVSVKDGERAVEEKLFSIEVRKELILAAGAFQTPQLLQASGIADEALLRRLNIPVQHVLPAVGRHLHDHINLPLFVSIDVVGPTLNQRTLLDPISFISYLFTGASHFGNFGVLGHVDCPLQRFGLTLFGAGAIDESALMSISNFKRSHFRALFPRYHNATQEGFVVISSCTQPRSRGDVTISAANTRRKPLIDPNYLSDASDVACSIRAVRAAVALVASQSFAELRPRIHWPRIPECANFGPFERDFKTNEPSDRYLECVVRHVGLTSHHPGGSCRMGRTAAQSAVDAKLRVHGVPNLRVVDASVLPTPLSGHPNSVLVGIAVRGAAMILSREQQSAGEEIFSGSHTL